MYDFHPYFTNDGSVGLYNKEFNDIYHSADGALTEAFEKFVLPVDIDSLIHKDSIKVLDLCYGIGYNTKSFLNFIFEKYSEIKFIKNFYHAKNNIETIHTNNILDNKNQIYNEQIYTNNILRNKDYNFTSEHSTYNETIYTNNTLAKIYIKAVDYDKILTFLSPFIKTGVKNVKFQNLDFDYKPVDRILKNKENILHRKIKNEINFLIFDKIAQNTPEIFDNSDFLSIVNSEKYAEYFDKRIKGIFNFYRNSIYKYTYDTANQLMEMESPEGKREYFYDMTGRLVMEKFNGEIDVEYKYGYLDKVIEVNRKGNITKFAYDGFGMLAQKTFHDGTTEVWVWDGLALIRRGSDIYVNEPHVSGGVPILSKTDCKRLPRHNNIR